MTCFNLSAGTACRTIIRGSQRCKPCHKYWRFLLDWPAMQSTEMWSQKHSICCLSCGFSRRVLNELNSHRRQAQGRPNDLMSCGSHLLELAVFPRRAVATLFYSLLHFIDGVTKNSVHTLFWSKSERKHRNAMILLQKAVITTKKYISVVRSPETSLQGNIIRYEWRQLRHGRTHTLRRQKRLCLAFCPAMVEQYKPLEWYWR